VFVASASNWWASFDFVEFSFFFKSLFSTEYAQCNVCRRVIGLFVQQRNLWCVWFMIREKPTQPWRNRNFVYLCTSYSKTCGTAYLYHHS
jgi:hypothetical protein